LAPCIFLAVRLIQGVFVGGVVPSSHTIGTETVPKHWRGLVSGMVGGGGAGLGALLTSIVFLVMSSIFPGDLFETWGWRAMFLSGILSAVCGLTLFNSLEESPLWKKLHNAHKTEVSQKKSSPLRQLISVEYRKTLLVNLIITISAGSVYYVTTGYLPTFIRDVNHLSNNESSLLLMATSLASIVAGVVFGILTEKIGRKKSFVYIGVIGFLVVPVCFLKLSTSLDIWSIIFYSLIIAFMGNAVLAPIPIFLNERFPTAIRASGTGLSWNIGFAIGGVMPVLVTLWSKALHGLPITLVLFSVVFFATYVIGAFMGGETRGQNM